MSRRNITPAIVLVLAGALLGSCTKSVTSPVAFSTREQLDTAEAFIDAFFSFDPQQLQPFLMSAPDSQPELLFYQGWAQGGNYKVLERSACIIADQDMVQCAITVEDDPVLALGIDYKVTDTFTLWFDEGQITAVSTSSDDQPVYYEAFLWVTDHMPDIMTGPCAGFFEGGPTPGDCARAMTEGYRRFALTLVEQ